MVSGSARREQVAEHAAALRRTLGTEEVTVALVVAAHADEAGVAEEDEVVMDRRLREAR